MNSCVRPSFVNPWKFSKELLTHGNLFRRLLSLVLVKTVYVSRDTTAGAERQRLGTGLKLSDFGKVTCDVPICGDLKCLHFLLWWFQKRIFIDLNFN